METEQALRFRHTSHIFIGILFLCQKRRNLKQTHANSPRYCNHVHKGRHPAWDDTATSCRPCQLLCSKGGLNFSAPAPHWTLACDELLNVSGDMSFSFYSSFHHLHSTHPLLHLSFKMEAFL